MEIIQINYNDGGFFKAIKNHKKIGELSYVWAGSDKLIIDHTNVIDEYIGTGIGNKLVMSAVDYARNNNIKIVPSCQFAKSVFSKTPEIRDVLFI